MVATNIWNTEWPNANTQRAYPLMEGQTLEDGSFRLPNDLIVDIDLPVSSNTDLDVTLFHISQVGVFGAGVTISIAYDGTTFATVSIATTGFTEYSTYAILGTNSFFDTRGRITIGKLSTILKYPGAWNFTALTAKLVPTVVRPVLRSLTSVRVQNGTDISSAISGDIILQAGANIQLSLDTTTNTIIVNAVENDYTASCVCQKMDLSAPPIRTINGVPPNISGEVTLIGTSCLVITPGTNAVQLDDKCATPCCDCRELEVIAGDLQTMQQQLKTVEDAATRLDGVVTNLSSNVMSSKLGVPQ